MATLDLRTIAEDLERLSKDEPTPEGRFVTLFVNGIILSGKLISRREFLKSVRDVAKSDQTKNLFPDVMPRESVAGGYVVDKVYLKDFTVSNGSKLINFKMEARTVATEILLDSVNGWLAGFGLTAPSDSDEADSGTDEP